MGKPALIFTMICAFMFLFFNSVSAQNGIRYDISLDRDWLTIADDSSKTARDGFEKTSSVNAKWQRVNVPHNWDAYEGYRRMRHGNRHGYAWYKKIFTVKQQPAGKRYFLFFEGVGSYATVWLNGRQVGYHAGGRTTFTIDVTDVIRINNKENLLAVRADHPANIKDLPWVCGGCSDERGFSEGSQPIGIFRPVHLIITDAVRIEPFGVHIWNDTTVSTSSAQLHMETEVKNYTAGMRNVTLVTSLKNKAGQVVFQTKTIKEVAPGNIELIKQEPPLVSHPKLWSLTDPYLYTIVSEVVVDGKLVDRLTTPYGIRSISWPVGKVASSNQFLLNRKPVFINGIAEYEHLIGNSHAFSSEQIKTRVMEMKATGFNAFRDAHSPHNLRYQDYWEKLGFLWWTQMGAHIWYDTPEFRENFKKLLTEWVKERRNSPSVVLWGLQNESKLPEDFARECTALIRKLDPTTSSQRLVTTCNGGTGTDWDVPQNWTGTYGGNPATYDDDLKRQVLIGEYGAWRTLDLHTEGTFDQNGPYSEDRMTELMEMKVRLAEKAKDSTTGHFMWLLTSHDNPGRVQGGEGYREPDRIGPVNYKGLMTPWEEPLDVFYMYRANYAPKNKEPMVYIVSHTWPDRWITPGKKDGIVVYSNCDEVELFNDVNRMSLGKRKRNGVGTHFKWDGVNVRYNVLYAIGYVNGKAVAKDYIVLSHLPTAPGFAAFNKDAKPVLNPVSGYNYVYRVNCGGPTYIDKNGNTWMADRQKTPGRTWGSTSWTSEFPGMPAYFASQRKTNDPITGTADWKLFQTFRFGREKLRYTFPLPDGEYLIELYFTEPWLGTGGGMDCAGWRLFDVAVNDKTKLRNVDIWKEVGHDAALRKVIKAKITGGELVLSFPKVSSGQAVISAIAIASVNKAIKPAAGAPLLIQHLDVTDQSTAKLWSLNTWLNTNEEQYSDAKGSFSALPSNLYGADWIRGPHTVGSSVSNPVALFGVSADADVFVAVDSLIISRPLWLKDFEDTKTHIQNSNGAFFKVYRKRYQKDATVSLGNNGTITNGKALMYTVVVNAATTIEPAYDLKPVISYKAVNANLRGAGIEKGKIDGKERVVFSKAPGEGVLEWDILIGAADIYSFNISYNNPRNETMTGKLRFIAADGTLMKEETVEFTATRPGKSNYISSSTGTMVNAGNYKVQLIPENAEGLSINTLDVQ